MASTIKMGVKSLQLTLAVLLLITVIPGASAARINNDAPPIPLVYVTSPANGAANVNANVNITSRAVTGATTYTIEISDNSSFENAKIRSGGRTLNFDSLQYNTLYYARVKTNLLEEYGMVTTFTTRTAASLAVVSSPADNTFNVNTILNITSANVLYASQYTIQLSETPDFSVVAFEVTGPTRTLAFSGLNYNTLYYNRVRTNLTETFGATRVFTTRTPESIAMVTTPANNAVGANATLNISSKLVPGATSYTIQLSESPDFTSVAFEVTGPTRTLAFSGLSYNTTYYNRVLTDLSAEYGWINSFTTRSPESITYVTSPANGAINSNASLNISSNNVPGASSYTIQLSESSDFSTIDFEGTGATRTIAFAGLKYNTTYYNRVITDLSVEFGQINSFTTRSPESITYVVSPADGAVGTNTSLNVSSNIVPGATQYTIQLSLSSDFSTIDFEATEPTRTIAFAGLTFSTTYYSRVSTDLSEEFGAVRSFTTRSAASVTYVSSPADGAVDRNTSLNISSTEVPGASQYIIQLAETPDFSSITHEAAGPSRTLAFPSLSYGTTYYSRVITDLSEEFGPIKSFTTRTAESITYVTSPVDGANTVNTVLNISSSNVPGATSYTIQLSESPDFSVIAFEASGSTRTLAFSGLEYNTLYYDRVITDMTDTYGAVGSFTTRTAESISYVTTPANNAVDANISINISSRSVPGATSYTIQLSEDPDFTSIAFEATGPTRTLAFTGLQFSTTYYNRVSTDISPEYGWINNFTTRSAESISYVASPANGAIDRNTTLNISSKEVAGATEYTIQLSETEDFSTVAFEGIGATRTIAFAGLLYNTTYYNRVMTDLSPEFGPVRSFTTRSPESITYVSSPADGSVGRNTILNVSSRSVPGATQYTIQLSETSDFSTVAFEGTGATRTILFSGLLYNTTYYSRVQTDLVPVYGAVKSFTTRTPESISYVTAPANGAENASVNPNITANNVPGASLYTIQLSALSDFSNVDFEASGSSRTQPFSGLASGTTYYSRVVTDLTEQFGEVRSFTTAGEPPVEARMRATEVASESEVPGLAESNVRVYPNPFREKLALYVESTDLEAEIALLDINGRSVHRSSEQTNRLIEINKPMSAGVYLLQVRTAKHIKVLRVMKID